MGYVRGFVHGAVAGTVLGLCVAPQPGRRTREQLACFASAARDGYSVARRTVRRVAPFAAGAAGAARDRVERIRRHDNGHAAIEFETPRSGG